MKLPQGMDVGAKDIDIRGWSNAMLEEMVVNGQRQTEAGAYDGGAYAREIAYLSIAELKRRDAW